MKIGHVFSKLQSLISSNKQNRTFQTWDEAVAKSGLGYQEKDLVNVVVEKTELLQSQIETDNLNLDSNAFRILASLATLKPKNNQLRVIDVGGGAGYHYLIARALLPKNIKLNWQILETPLMAISSQKFSNSELSFVDNIGLLDKQDIDLLFTSATLQYLPDPINVLKYLVQIDPRVFWITRTPFSENQQTLFAIQESKLIDNGPGFLQKMSEQVVKYPLTIVPIDQVISIISETRNVVAQFSEGDEGFSFSGQRFPIFGLMSTSKKLSR